MKYNFDVKEFCNNLRETKPPYDCPIPGCGKTYKSWSGIQFHMYKYDHDNPDSGGTTPASKGKSVGRKKGKAHHRSRRSPTPPEPVKNMHRETLTYAEAQRLVEVDINGQLRRINIYEPLRIITKAPSETIKEEKKEEVVVAKTPSSSKKKQTSVSLNKKMVSPAKLPEAQFKVLEDYVQPKKKHIKQTGFYRYIEQSVEELDNSVEYDMDDQDYAWLKIINAMRKRENAGAVSQEMFELAMDRFEKEAHFQAQNSGQIGPTIDDDAVCSICMDGECQNTNVILFCDMCNLAVHQECYGVPYIPEGQWLCRRCLQSPSRAVDCCLCPNKGGAFKQTEDGRWAHVMCAIWIPEVIFANTVFLEPVDGLQNVPPARWKLTCYICKQKNVGACIQCHKTNCYTAFHVTCAQQAGLYMKVESIKSAVPTSPSGLAIRKTAFCDVHLPANMKGSSMVANSDSDDNDRTAQEKSRAKMRKARKILAEKRNAVPVVSLPIIPEKRLEAISKKITVAKSKESLMKKLLAYWTLKRQSRNGVPLLRRLQSNHMGASHRPEREGAPVNDKESAAMNAQLKYWKRLRQDLEKARLLVELIRKREKLKREELRLHTMMTELKLSPLVMFLQRVHEELKEIDTSGIFAQPVDVEKVPDYFDYISSPMDLQTVQEKITSHKYGDLSEFEQDVELMIRNCMLYNSKDTPFYKAALRMRDQGGSVMRAARRMADYIGFEPDTGCLAANRPEGAVTPYGQTPLDMDAAKALIHQLNDGNLSGEEHVKQLVDKLDMAILEKGRKSKVAKLIRKELMRVRRGLADRSNDSEIASGVEESSAEDTDAPHGMTPDIGGQLTTEISKPDLSEVEVESGKPDETTVGSPSEQAPPAPSPGTVNRRTAILFASKKLGRRPLAKSPLAAPASPSKASSTVDDLPDTKKSSKHKTKQAEEKTSPKGKKRSAEEELEGPPHKKATTPGKPGKPLIQRQDSFSKYRGNMLLSASELDELSETETEASETESETSMEDPLAGSMSAGSTSSRRLRSSDDKYSVPLTALDLVWAKCRGYPWYPAMIIDPKMPKGYTFNGVPIPKPPLSVLDLQRKFDKPVYLILFFDARRTWQWLPRDKLEPLGVDSEYDQQKLSDNRKPAIKKAVMNAYEKALRHQRKIDDGDDDDDSGSNK